MTYALRLLTVSLFFTIFIFAKPLSEKYPSYTYVFSEFDVDESYIYDSSFESFVNKNEKKIKKFYKNSMGRGKVLIPMVQNHLIDDELSDIFIYISMIESGFTIDIVSPQKAVGIWQFMPATAKYFNLKVCGSFDERCDPESSTKAAMKYLKKLHKQFGKWYLAIMAYNCGEGRMAKAIKKAKSSELNILLNPFAKYLPLETRDYMKKILLIAMIGESEVLNMSSDSNKEFLVDVDSGTKLSTIAKLLNIKTSILQKLNPYIKQSSNSKSYKIAIPEDKMMLFYMKYKVEEQIVEIKPYLVSHYVTYGDTLDSISSKYESSVDDIVSVNKLNTTALTLDRLLLIPISKIKFEKALSH